MIQALIDTHCQTAPLTMMGDLNTSLPQKLLLGNKWSKVSPFNHFSAMLYDFISYNELYVANFAFDQCLNYTYHKASHVSYIDHILVSKYINKKVVKCKILSDDSSNVSDHYALTLLISLDMYSC